MTAPIALCGQPRNVSDGISAFRSGSLWIPESQGCAPPGRWVYVLFRSRAAPATALPPPLQFVGDSISAARELRSNSAVLTEPVAHAWNADAENVNIGIDPNAELIEIDGDDVGTTVEDTSDRYHRIA